MEAGLQVFLKALVELMQKRDSLEKWKRRLKENLLCHLDCICGIVSILSKARTVAAATLAILAVVNVASPRETAIVLTCRAVISADLPVARITPSIRKSSDSNKCFLLMIHSMIMNL